MPKNIFKGTAWYYARYRPGYPKKFFGRVVKTFKLNGDGRLLDLGCGPGQLAIPLARYFEEVIAMDPDAAMLKEGKLAGKKAKVKNIAWKKGTSADLRASMGKFRLVVMGRSFHWMDQKKTLVTLYKMIEPGGGVVIVSEGRGYGAWTQGSGGWRAALNATVQKYLGPRRRAGSGYYGEPKKRFENFIRESPFKTYTVYRQKVKNTWDLEGMIGYSYSRSSSSKPLFGRNVRAFERDLKEALREANSTEKFTDSPTLEALIIKRK